MAKSATKTSKKAPAKTSKAAKAPAIDTVCADTLEKLRTLGIEPGLQNDLEWCLGSYRADQNPVGLYQMGSRALDILKREKEKKTKGITAKLINDLEKAIASR